MNFVLTEGKIWPKVTRARGSINSQLAKKLVLHLCMYQQAIRKKLERGKQKKAMLRESDFQEQDQIILHRRILHCLNRVPRSNHAAALAPLFVSVLWKYVLFLSLPACLF